MSIGKQFLERLAEAKKPVAAKAEAPKPTFVADAGTERMKAMMRDTPDNMHQDLADHIAEMANAAGVPGAFLNKTEIRKAFIQSAIKLKNMPTRLKYFRILHTELTQLRIGNLPSSGGGGITMKKGAEDEKAIVGTAIQELLAEILVDFGVPMEYFTKEAPTPLKTSLKRAGTMIMSNSAVKNAIKALARGEGIRSGDDTVGSKKPGMKVKVQEAAESEDEKVKFLKSWMKAYSSYIGDTAAETAKNFWDSLDDTPRMQVKAEDLDLSGADVKRIFKMLMATPVKEAEAVQSSVPQKIEAGTQAFIEAAHQLCAAFGIPQKTMDLPVVAMGIKRAAMKDASNATAKTLMVKLLAQLQKRD